MVSGIFGAVDRCHMWRVPVAVRSPDSKFLPVCVDPFPEDFAGMISLVPGFAGDAHDVGGKSVTIAAAKAAAMVGPGIRRFQAARERLTVVVAECAGDAGR